MCGGCDQTPQISPDGRKVYYFKHGCSRDGAPYVEHDLVSESVRTLISGVGPQRLDLSRDGKFLVGVTPSSALVIVDVSSGRRHELFRPQAPTTLRWPTVAWTPDGSAVIVVANEKVAGSASPGFLNGSRPDRAGQRGDPAHVSAAAGRRQHPRASDGKKVAS